MDKLDQSLDQYLKLQQEIFDYFGYVEDWRVIPIDDRREYYWQLTGEGRGDEVKYSLDPTLEDENKLYSDEIYTQRFLPKWVYRGENYTMVCVDTHTDMNFFLAIYDNKKEVCN